MDWNTDTKAAPRSRHGGTVYATFRMPNGELRALLVTHDGDGWQDAEGRKIMAPLLAWMRLPKAYGAA